MRRYCAGIRPFRKTFSPKETLERSLGRFKTVTMRGLGESASYFHTGQARTLEDAVSFYRRVSDLSRLGKLRNPPLEFFAIRLGEEDGRPLVAFLRALNEFPAIEVGGLP